MQILVLTLDQLDVLSGAGAHQFALTSPLGGLDTHWSVTTALLDTETI